MSDALRHVAVLSDGREVAIEIAEAGDRLTVLITPARVAGLATTLTSADALTVALALQHAAVYVGQREARRRHDRRPPGR